MWECLCGPTGLAGLKVFYDLCGMYLKYVRREMHVGGKVLTQKYYRLTESYRDSNGKTRQHMLLALGYLPELPTFEQRDMYMRCLNALVLRGEYNKSNTEISLHHSQTYHFGFPNGPFQLAKQTVLRPKTDRFITQNGMY